MGLWGARPPEHTHPRSTDMRSLLGGDGTLQHIFKLYLASFRVHGLKRMFTFDTGRAGGQGDSSLLSLSVRAAVTKYHKLDGLNSEHLFSTVLEAGRS